MKQNKIKQNNTLKMVQKTIILAGTPELRERLPRGGVQVLASKYGKSWQWVHKVVTGKFNGDPRIIADAIVLANEEDKRKEDLVKYLQQHIEEN